MQSPSPIGGGALWRSQVNVHSETDMLSRNDLCPQPGGRVQTYLEPWDSGRTTDPATPRPAHVINLKHHEYKLHLIEARLD